MTREPTPITPADLRALLDSPEDDPALVLHEGLVHVAGSDRPGLELITRTALIRDTGKSDFTDEELAQRAAALSATTNTLGG